MKILRNVILVILVLTIVLSLFGACSTNQFDQFPTMKQDCFVDEGKVNKVDDVNNLEVTSSPSPSPTSYISISQHPQSQAFFPYSYESLSLVATSSNSSGLTYEWFVNGFAVIGNNYSSFSVQNLSVGDYKIKCKVSAVGAVSVFSEEASIKILPACHLFLDIEGDSLNIVLGEKKYITASIDNDNILFRTSFNWRVNSNSDYVYSSKFDLSKLPLGVHFVEVYSNVSVGSSHSNSDRRFITVFVSEKPVSTPIPSPEVTPDVTPDVKPDVTPDVNPAPAPTSNPSIFLIVLGCLAGIVLLVVVIKKINK